MADEKQSQSFVLEIVTGYRSLNADDILTLRPHAAGVKLTVIDGGQREIASLVLTKEAVVALRRDLTKAIKNG